MPARRGSGSKCRDIVLGGSFIPQIDVRQGDVIPADYGPLGAIGLAFV